MGTCESMLINPRAPQKISNVPEEPIWPVVDDTVTLGYNMAVFGRAITQYAPMPFPLLKSSKVDSDSIKEQCLRVSLDISDVRAMSTGENLSIVVK